MLKFFTTVLLNFAFIVLNVYPSFSTGIVNDPIGVNPILVKDYDADKEIKYLEDPTGVDCIQFSITTKKKNYQTGERFKVNVQMNYVKGLDTKWKQENCQNFSLKVVLPKDFIKVGGDYVDFENIDLSESNPQRDIYIEGYFISPKAQNTFMVLKGPKGSDWNTTFIKKKELNLASYGVLLDGVLPENDKSKNLRESAVAAACSTPTGNDPTEKCAGSTFTISVTGCASGSTYKWYTGATGGTATATVTTASWTTPAVSTNTSYWVTCTSSGCTESARKKFDLTVNAVPTITGGATTICSGATTTWTGTGTAATSNPWISSNTATATVSNTGIITGGTTAGTATITYKNSQGCTSTRVITVGATIVGPTSVCVGSTIVLTGSGTAATTSPWISSSTTMATVSNTGVVTGVATGTTTITYKNSQNCTQTLSVTVNASPTITGGATTICNGATTTWTGSGTAATNNPWISSNTAVATVSNTGVITGGTTAGTSTITYKNNLGCTVTRVITVNIPSVTGPTSVCVGSTISLTGSGTPATTSPWTSSSTTIATVSNTGVVTGISAGTTTITYKNSQNCTRTVSVTVNT
ncbi:MAG: Ig-like domain-containing protein, partial [Leadbetterella sp.]